MNCPVHRARTIICCWLFFSLHNYFSFIVSVCVAFNFT